MHVCAGAVYRMTTDNNCANLLVDPARINVAGVGVGDDKSKPFLLSCMDILQEHPAEMHRWISSIPATLCQPQTEEDTMFRL